MLDKKHLMIQQLTREFAVNEIEPCIDYAEEHGEFPDELWEKAARYGFTGCCIPKEYGGQGADFFASILMMEQICRTSVGAASMFMANSLSGMPILKCGTEEQKQKYLRPVAEGTKRCAFALTEPGAGSDTGALIAPNPFDNAYVAVGSSLREGSVEKIEVSQPEIGFEAYQTSYAAFLDLVLQGVMSPCTLGIDLKRVDNAEAQREKEKITLLVRSKIVAALGAALACLAERMLMTDDLMHGEAPGSYAASVRFGEYASPDFGSAVEVVARAREGGFMSVEQAVEELYGDTWTAEEKAAECARIREESEPHRSDAG